MTESKRIVIALGGNALEKKGLPPTAESQHHVVSETVKFIADIIEEGHEVILSHGNGPQVGRILLASEGSAEITPAMPFDACGAMSQGYIGYHLQQCLQMEMIQRKLDKPVATIVTQVEVCKDDQAFQNPTKPIGPFYSKEQADVIAKEQGYSMKEDAGRGYRRVVPSPIPVSILEISAIKTLVKSGAVVIAGGGGGVPVVCENGKICGVAAVIDKDFASEKLAEELDADFLIILTEVEKVCLNFNKPDQKVLEVVSASEMEKYCEEGHFAPGSMLPKVKASIKFAKSKPGRTAVISSLEFAKQAVKNTAGTRISD